MKDKRQKKSTHKKNRSAPDHRLTEANPDPADETPQIYQIIARHADDAKTRRGFLKNLTGAAGLAALSEVLSGCNNSEYGVEVKGEKCTCHVVCSCDTVGAKSSKYGQTYETYWENSVCTCDTVCTCDSVCMCDTVCTCESEGSSGSGSGHYWYPN